MYHRERPAPALKRKPLLFVLSGPSGAGKDAVLAKIKDSGNGIHHVVTVTTRPQRTGEIEDTDYHFVSIDKFQKMIENKELLEWAKVYDNYYGVPQGEVQQALGRGQDAIVKVDTQGAASIKSILPQSVLIFLIPPSGERLATHLRLRCTETDSDLALRLQAVEQEMKSLHLFDYVVMNYPDQIDLAVAQIEAIIIAEKCRRKNLDIKAFVNCFEEAIRPPPL